MPHQEGWLALSPCSGRHAHVAHEFNGSDARMQQRTNASFTAQRTSSFLLRADEARRGEVRPSPTLRGLPHIHHSTCRLGFGVWQPRENGRSWQIGFLREGGRDALCSLRGGKEDDATLVARRNWSCAWVLHEGSAVSAPTSTPGCDMQACGETGLGRTGGTPEDGSREGSHRKDKVENLQLRA